MAIKGNVRIGAYQFKGTPDINKNLKKILSGITMAASEKLDIVVFHECALTGYAGIELNSVNEIDRKELLEAEKVIINAASKNKLNVIFGSTTLKKQDAFNSLCLVDDTGKKHAPYFKRAMYGADYKNYKPGNKSGIINLNKIKIGLRICFDFRFPEYFRELLIKNVDLAVIAFSMVGKNNKKYNTAKAHLISRAAENGIYVVSANNLNGVQNCPTCIIDPDGNVLAEANPKKEMLISATIATPKKNPVREKIRMQAKDICKNN